MEKTDRRLIGNCIFGDDAFHNSVLALKIPRAQKIPEVRNILEDRAEIRRLKSAQLAMSSLTDLDLAIISPEMPMEEILKYRHYNEKHREQAREELGWLAHEIKENPWDRNFADELDDGVIPKIHQILETNKKVRDSWLHIGWGKNALKAAGIAASAAATTISLAFNVTPLLPVALATGVLGLLGGIVIPGAELAIDWKKGRQEAMGNGLHYLIKIKGR